MHAGEALTFMQLGLVAHQCLYVPTATQAVLQNQGASLPGCSKQGYSHECLITSPDTSHDKLAGVPHAVNASASLTFRGRMKAIPTTWGQAPPSTSFDFSDRNRRATTR